MPPRLRATALRWNGEQGAAWLAGLPAQVAAAARRWSLDVGAPFLPGGQAAWVAPVTRADGTGAVLKVTFPHREATHEAAGLRLWGGAGAIRLLDVDETGYVLLVERCVPGTLLADAAAGADVVAAGSRLLRLLWSAPVADDHPFELLADVLAEWADGAVDRFGRGEAAGDPSLVAEGVDLMRRLPGDATEQVLLHQDLHPGNVLAAERERWLAIDPKPMVGDPAFDPVQLLVQTRPDPLGAADPRRAVRERLAVVADGCGLDRRRVALWGLARSVEWAGWHGHVGDPAAGADAMRWARVLATLA